MDDKIATRWIAALRSGSYPQGTGVLYNDRTGAFCCIGVLCDLISPRHFSYSDAREGAQYNQEFEDKLVTMNDGSFVMGTGTRGSRKHSFEEIAAFIESNLGTR